MGVQLRCIHTCPHADTQTHARERRSEGQARKFFTFKFAVDGRLHFFDCDCFFESKSFRIRTTGNYWNLKIFVTLFMMFKYGGWITCQVFVESRMQMSDTASNVEILTTFASDLINTYNNKRKTDKGDVVYFNFPFLGDRIQTKIYKVFRDAQLPVRIYNKSQTLRGALKQKEPPGRCTMKDCPIKEERLCLQRNCVYKDIYIGSSVRHLHTRFHKQ